MKLIFSSSSTNRCYEAQVTNQSDKVRFKDRREILPHASYIQKLVSTRVHDLKLVWCFRRSGVLELYKIVDNEYVKIYQLSNCKKDEKDFVVGLVLMGQILYCCSNKGRLTLIDMNYYRITSSVVDLDTHVLQLSEPISTFVVNPRDQWTCACGGYNNQLQIYKLMTPFNGILTNNELFKVLNYTSITKILPNWVARVNRKQGYEEFPWITDIVFMDEDREGVDHILQKTVKSRFDINDDNISICCVTQFGKLNYYQTSVSQYPINELTISNHRIRKLTKLKTGDLLFIDSFGSMGIIRNEKLLYHYRIQNFGSLSGLDVLEIGEETMRPSEEDEDLIRLAAKRQSHVCQYKLQTSHINDIFIVFTTIIGDLKMIKLKNGNNEYDVIAAGKLPKTNNINGYSIPCLSYDYDDDYEIIDEHKPMIKKARNDGNKLKIKKMRVSSYI